MEFYRIEYEYPPFRAIYAEYLEADDEEMAKKLFHQKFPHANIRKIDPFVYKK